MNITDRAGRTSLQHAVYNGHVEVKCDSRRSRSLQSLHNQIPHSARKFKPRIAGVAILAIIYHFVPDFFVPDSEPLTEQCTVHV